MVTFREGDTTQGQAVARPFIIRYLLRVRLGNRDPNPNWLSRAFRPESHYLKQIIYDYLFKVVAFLFTLFFV
jgi:hypothetical protein